MPRRRFSRHRALTAGLVGLVLLAGCTASPGSSVTDAESVGDRVQARYEAIDRYEATVTKTVRTPNGASSVRATVTADTSEDVRIRYHTGPRAGTVATVDAASQSTPPFSAGVRTATDGRVPTYGALAAELVRSNDVTVERTAVVGGHSTVVVSLVPQSEESNASDADDADANDTAANETAANGTTASVERRVWVDTERLIPLKIETTWSVGNGETVTETVRYADVTLSESGSNHTDARVEAPASALQSDGGVPA